MIYSHHLLHDHTRKWHSECYWHLLMNRWCWMLWGWPLSPQSVMSQWMQSFKFGYSYCLCSGKGQHWQGCFSFHWNEQIPDWNFTVIHAGVIGQLLLSASHLLFLSGITGIIWYTVIYDQMHYVFNRDGCVLERALKWPSGNGVYMTNHISSLSCSPGLENRTIAVICRTRSRTGIPTRIKVQQVFMW